MKTDDFINALVVDSEVLAPPSGRKLGGRVALGLIVSLVIFFTFLGGRADFREVVADPHVVFKFVFSASMFGALLPLVVLALRPETRLARLLRWFAPPALVLGCGVLFQLLTSPPDYWLSGMVGRYPNFCVTCIPLLAAAPLAMLLTSLRQGATTQPVLAGALAGALSGSLAAFIYALHCPDDSALFVALWYSLAIGITTLAGAFAGDRLLRW